VWNGLDYAAASFPVSTVNPAIDVKKPPHEFLSKADESTYNLCVSISFVNRKLYFLFITTSFTDDPVTFKGAPIGLQLVGRTLEEEAVIAMTEIVDAAIKELQESEGTLPNLKTAL